MNLISMKKGALKVCDIPEFFDNIKKQFPDEQFLLLPDGFWIREMTKSELKQVVDRLNDYYDGLKDDE